MRFPMRNSSSACQAGDRGEHFTRGPVKCGLRASFMAERQQRTIIIGDVHAWYARRLAWRAAPLLLAASIPAASRLFERFEFPLFLEPSSVFSPLGNFASPFHRS